MTVIATVQSTKICQSEKEWYGMFLDGSLQIK